MAAVRMRRGRMFGALPACRRSVCVLPQSAAFSSVLVLINNNKNNIKDRKSSGFRARAHPKQRTLPAPCHGKSTLLGLAPSSSPAPAAVSAGMAARSRAAHGRSLARAPTRSCRRHRGSRACVSVPGGLAEPARVRRR